MSDSKSGGFPWASVAVLVAFVTSTQLVPHAFDQLRPAEKERAQAATAADLEVEARLWEDPFVAVRRHEAERLDRCDKLYKDPARATTCKLQGVQPPRSPAEFMRRLDADGDQDLDETLVLAVLVPGNAFVGAEEGRRRTRYAVLAGLQAQGYVPDNAERLGLLQLDMEALRWSPPTAASTPKPAEPDLSRPGLLLPFELLSASGLSAAAARPAPARSSRVAATVEDPATAARYTQVALLWVDETALPAPKLDALAALLEAVYRPVMGATPDQSGESGQRRPRLAVIGPSTSDALRTALTDLRRASRRYMAADWRSLCDAGRQASYPVWGDAFQRGYWLLSQASLLSPFATAGDRRLEELDGSSLGQFVERRFCRMQGGHQDPPTRLVRMIAPDDEVLQRLLAELRLRLPSGQPRRVVLVVERDSLYAQALIAQLRADLAQDPQLRLDEVYFFRGLDGVTTRDAGRDDAGRTATKTDAAQARVEWPEARDQLDYLRRLAQQLRRSEQRRDALPIGAIGLMASDVHDKLLVLQALHENFADKVFFTTDLDARFLHPRTQSFTRNLLVASSLPLEFPSEASPRCARVAAHESLAAPDLGAGNPPWRDVYQSATYLAARQAGCRSKACRAVEQCAAQEALAAPSLYEIGRNSAVALDGYAFDRQVWPAAHARRLLGLVLLLKLGLGLLVWPGAPSLQAVLGVWRWRASAAHAPLGQAETVFAMLHVLLLSFAACTVLELMRPGLLTLDQMLVLGCGTAIAFALLLWPHHRFGRAGQAGQAGRGMPGPRTIWVLRVLVLGLTLLVWWTLALRELPLPAAPCRDCEPALWLEGVSAWPTQLLHLLALGCMLYALDATWSRAMQGLRADSAWLGLPPPSLQLARRGKLGLGLVRRAWTNHLSLWRWQAEDPQRVDVRRLWHQYLRRGSRQPRALRVLVGYVATLGVVVALFLAFSDGALPELPVRGLEHRRLVGLTLAACLLGLPLVVVAVGDATLLASRFFQLLGAARSLYPAATVRRFADALGAQHAPLWRQPIEARPEERGHATASALVPALASGAAAAPNSLAQSLGKPHHSLLDDWIDVQLVARRSAHIAPLVVAPFVVLALLVVGRSRLFDSWSLTLPIAVAASAYLLGAIVLALWLKRTAEQARSRALASMAADLRWLGGETALKDLVEPFKRLVAAVENEKRGAFAPLFEQPLLKALLVPLGGAGGAQLIDYFLLAR